jgi:regulator of RNase E activity RraB
MGWFGKGKGRSVPVAGDNWDFYSYVYGEGQRAMIRFDVTAAKEPEHAGYGNCRRVIVFIDPDSVRDDGLPIKEQFEALTALEDALIRDLTDAGVDCRFIGCMTYGGMRDFVFQVEDTAGFAKVASRWVGDRGGNRVGLEESDGWDFFDRKVRPEPGHWRQIENRRVIQALLEAGSNPERPHPLEHAFRGPPENLKKIAAALEADGFSRMSFEGDFLVLSKPSPLDLDEISRLTDALEGFSASVGAEYDGWGTPVVR